MKKTLRTWSDEQLIKAVAENNNISAVIRALGLTTLGFNTKTIKKHIALLELSTSHFLSTNELRAFARSHRKVLTDDEIFCVNGPDRGHVRELVIKRNLIPYSCSICNISDWQNDKLVLHLDHINGVNNDHRLENLRFLCPNCHSQTKTYCGRNTPRKLLKEPRTCLFCPKQIGFASRTCYKCQAKARTFQYKINWPSDKELIVLLQTNSYSAVGRQLGVSDNAVRKHLRNRRLLMPGNILVDPNTL